MQNKPNLRKAKMNLTSYRHKYYEKMRVREPRKNKPNSPIEHRTLSPLVAGTPPIKPVSASLKVTKNAKKTLVLRCFGDVSTCFPLFVTAFSRVSNPNLRIFVEARRQSNPISNAPPPNRPAKYNYAKQTQFQFPHPTSDFIPTRRGWLLSFRFEPSHFGHSNLFRI